MLLRLSARFRASVEAQHGQPALDGYLHCITRLDISSRAEHVYRDPLPGARAARESAADQFVPVGNRFRLQAIRPTE